MQSDLIFSMRDLRLIEMIYKFVELAPTAGHIYKICDILNEEVSEYILVIPIYKPTQFL